MKIYKNNCQFYLYSTQYNQIKLTTFSSYIICITPNNTYQKQPRLTLYNLPQFIIKQYKDKNV